jgi:hypothetical protein
VSELRAALDSLPQPPEGVAAFDPATSLRLLKASFRCMPQPGDGVVRRRGRVRNLVAVPPSFPTTAPPVVENPALFERLEVDALFFAFYFQQGTPQQMLAARELKRSNWRAPSSSLSLAPLTHAQALPQKVQHLVCARGGAQGVHGRVRAGALAVVEGSAQAPTLLRRAATTTSSCTSGASAYAVTFALSTQISRGREMRKSLCVAPLLQ